MSLKYKINLKVESPKKLLKKILLTLLGTFIMSLGIELCIIPSNLITGGTSGIALCFKNINPNISPELIITIFTVSLFVVGFIVLGFDFSIKSFISTLFYPLFIYLLKEVLTHTPWLFIQNSKMLEGNIPMQALVSSVIGGLLVGTGLSITFIGGGSTGGIDIITFILCKYIKKLKSSYSLFIIDSIIIITGFITNKNHDIALTIFGILSSLISSVVIDKLFVGSTKPFIANIVSEKYQEISDELSKSLNKTVSVVNIDEGNKKMISVYFEMKQHALVTSIVSKIDPNAFMTILRAHEVNGKTF